MMDELIALAGDLVFERKRLSESLRRLEEALLHGSVANELFRTLGVQNTEVLHAELDILSRGLERVGALTKTLVLQVNQDRLDRCEMLIAAAAEALRAGSTRLGKSITIETNPNGARLDRELMQRFSPILMAMLDTLIEFSVEGQRERTARKKRANAYFKIEVKTTDEGHRLVVACDGNGILPPMVREHGLRLAELGLRASFEGKPGQWSAWIFHLPSTLGAFRCVQVKKGSRRLWIPSVSAADGGILESGLWTLDSEIRRTSKASANSGVPMPITAGTHTVRYVFDEVLGIEEVFMKQLDKAFDGNGRFLGVVADENADSRARNELCLVLNPAYLVYGEDAILERVVEGMNAV